MIRRIYHGGASIVRSPRFGTGNAFNDFGLGFYCCEQATAAAEWAVSRDRNGFVSAYNIDTDGLRVINLCSPRYNVLHWLSLLMSFRTFEGSGTGVHRAQEYISKHFSLDFQGSDCIIGWRADNRCFALAMDFLAGDITYRTLERCLKSDDANRQFVLKSNRAFDRIIFSAYDSALAEEYYPVSVSRELRALKETEKVMQKTGPGDMTIDRIIEEEIKPYDPRLR